MLKAASLAVLAATASGWQVRHTSRTSPTLVRPPRRALPRVLAATPSLAEEAFAALNTRDEVDLESPQSTFQFLCTLAGEPVGSNTRIDVDDFVLAFQQFFNDGIPLDPDCLEELKGALGSADDEDVTMTDWSRFHNRWLTSTVASGRLFATAVAHLEGVVEWKKVATALEEEKKLRSNQQEELEKQYKKQLDDFKEELQKVRQ